MESVRKLETTIALWYKGLPHLPKNGQKWLAVNAWWLVLIGVILSVILLASSLMLTFLASAFLTGIAGPVGAALGGIALLSVLIYLAFGIVEVVLYAMAISPLKMLKKRGWDLLFIVALVNVISFVLSFIFTLDFLGLIREALAVAVGFYLLFEVRDYFVRTGDTTKTSAKAK